ncbi:hypothetical protein [Massilia glaciei]|uniref:Uncharacterized protein n=1 Tax=Massilia glaciei TaxID=1524097 RepID=A0A2U2HJM5_9BURK|nr:hypothetical protein [Massilia glaciei]PWF47606.1 hypothetical protein C7C56_014765 [Massilia glaciei]
MIRIEFETPIESRCECCGKTTVRLTRLVYRDNDAFAVYYASFTPDHNEKVLSGIIGLGEWGDDAVGPEARVAFPFQITWRDDCFNVHMIDAHESGWNDVTFLGRIQNREESLVHEWIKDVFHITDHMVADDNEIVQFFS